MPFIPRPRPWVFWRVFYKILQGVRDALLLVVSVVLMSTSYGKWVVEPAHYVLFGMAAGLFVL
jgi:hypothetical protein